MPIHWDFHVSLYIGYVKIMSYTCGTCFASVAFNAIFLHRFSLQKKQNAGKICWPVMHTLNVMINDVQVYYLRASSEVERRRWVTALTLAKAKAVQDLESGILFNTHQLATYMQSTPWHNAIDDEESV